ncbi:MAG: protein translocase subunit SecF [Candidatus Portnoybacteria bacterium CG10_big_fil_rev_8_21_14_0_10_44_7]|uniref:Protein-export membrane protein SecF n=1 Tax=Candidatus Portnoybacteria bacterium CG10_big_fil_rev_8_21_14_0_10_44_7 TaxID=1974816 RepID=A0A2M8KIN2_9BACT|nr:MAG: protein translocase subunit SecF [Candidatus Portnoybacteria bacterium CG10_big_fil_rev_8_21_14_0_10_44_7]
MFIINHKKIFLGIAVLLMLLSIAALLIWGLRLSIDFTGGSLLEVAFTGGRPEVSQIQDSLKDLNLGEVSVQPLEQRAVLLRLKDINEETHQKILTQLKSDVAGAEVIEKRFESVGPVIGQELKRKAWWAIFFVLLMIVLFVAYAFRKVSRPIASWRYGVAAIFALAHDVLIPSGVFAVLGRFAGKEVGLLFVTALLTILGFSVHDTIVVFDRIRENLRRGAGNTFNQTVGLSITQVFARSVNTSVAVLLTLVAVFLFGGESIKDFALVLIIGLFSGTYSSLFVASPLLVWWQEWKSR